MSKKTTVSIGGREIPLQFCMPEFADMEEAIGNLSLIEDLLLKGKRRIRNIAAALRIMGNAALRAAGEKPDLTDEWVLNHMVPRKLAEYQTVALAAINDGMRTESSEEQERDLVLEEIERKKDQNS